MKALALIVATLVAVLVPAVFFGGCVSMPLPPDATDSSLPSPHLDLRVGVERNRVAPFSAELVHALRASSMFARVDFTDRLTGTPDLVAKIEHGWQANAAIPFFTVLSLGLVPTIVDESYGLAFSLHAPESPAERVLIDTRWSGSSWFGLAAAPLNALPGRTSEDWRNQPRWIAHVRREVRLRSAELAVLARRGRSPR